MTSFPQVSIYHDRSEKATPVQRDLIEEVPIVQVPESDFLCDAACAVLELIRAHLKHAPTQRDLEVLDNAAEQFFLSLGV